VLSSDRDGAPWRVGVRLVAASLVVVAACWTGRTAARAAVDPAPPAFRVDPSWPRPLPNQWRLGPVSGISVDARDHVWIVHRAEAVAQAGGTPAPPVVEFDAAGSVVQAWGGPGAGYDWPEQAHGLTVDARDRVWITGNGDPDSQILAFDTKGRFLLQIGHAGLHTDSNDTANLGHATQVRLDQAHGELYVSDGERGTHHRVIVFDADTGAYKRHWGAYGARPDDAAVTARADPDGAPPRQFGSAVHCVHLSRDGLVYVCDRSNDRLQVFHEDGRFVAEAFIARETRGTGSVWDVEFSPDQAFLYLADGTNQKVWILRRETLTVVGSFGGAGAAPGQFATSLHDLAVDSHGNLYTGEAATGGRIQKFVRQ
jgi:hypothetical protein